MDFASFILRSLTIAAALAGVAAVVMSFFDLSIKTLTPNQVRGWSLAFILIALVRKDRSYEKIAYANLVLTVFGTIAAGITGAYDNNLNYLGDAPNASLKMILAILMLVISALTVFFRMRNPDLLFSKGKALYFGGYLVSFALALVLGFLGGVILYGF